MFGLGIGKQYYPTVYPLIDSFNRANNNTSMGKAETGQTWTNVVGVWGIENQAARVFTVNPSSDVATASIEVNLSQKALVSVRFYMGGEYVDHRLLFRYLDRANHLMVRSMNSSYVVMSRVLGSVTTLATISQTPVSGDKITVRLNGNRIGIFINGILLLSLTESQFQNETKVGLAAYTTNYPANTMKFDSLKVVKL